MTVIAAALTSDGVVMAADAQVTVGWEKQERSTPKLWVTKQFAIGGSGGVRELQIIRHHVDWPKYRPDEDTDLERFMVKDLIPEIRKVVKDNGALKTESGIESYDAGLLVSVADKIMRVGSVGDVLIDPRGRMAIGSGYAEALGHLGDAGPWAEADVIEAVRRATITARGCSGPISVCNARALTIRTIT
jgi:ATP-dependent protease HslVU (ClpYQ) peptidase subunit